MEESLLFRYLVSAVALAFAGPAAAEPLATLWTFEPVAPAPTTVSYGQRFFEQRLLPIKLVRIATATTGQPADTLLYLVYTATHQVGWCTFKDLSANHVAKSLFIPVLDKRPCFLDRDGDGRLDATFSVFDKYGSMATPSGNPGDAAPLPQPIAYQPVDPHLAPATMRIGLILDGGSDPARVRITVSLAKGARDRWEALVGNTPRQGNTLVVLNTQVTVQSIAGKQASIVVRTDPTALVTGSSGGVLTITQRPTFLR